MDWIASILMLIGLYVLPKHKIFGMLIQCLATTVFMFYFMLLGNIPIVFMELVLLILGIRTIIIWRDHVDR